MLRPWLNWIELLTSDQKVAGSSPAGRATFHLKEQTGSIGKNGLPEGMGKIGEYDLWGQKRVDLGIFMSNLRQILRWVIRADGLTEGRSKLSL